MTYVNTYKCTYICSSDTTVSSLSTYRSSEHLVSISCSHPGLFTNRNVSKGVDRDSTNTDEFNSIIQRNLKEIEFHLHC